VSTSADELTGAVLSLLIDADKPTGASVIHERLLGQGFQLSEPTVGRLLREFDRLGYTTSEGRLGRLVTSKGRAHLQRLEDTSSRDRNAKQFLQSLRAETLADVLNVVVARRGIEREIARAAAINATAEDIAALHTHDRRIRDGEIVDGLHGLLSTAAHNPVLDSVMRLITHDPDIGRLIGELLRERGKLLDIGFNRRVIDAIERRDPDAAEAAVLAHLDEVLDTVQEFWSATRRTEEARTDPAPRRRRSKAVLRAEGRRR
jgi:GntR family transcriptional repressor for pyruvate dehydrogenase complex